MGWRWPRWSARCRGRFTPRRMTRTLWGLAITTWQTVNPGQMATNQDPNRVYRPSLDQNPLGSNPYSGNSKDESAGLMDAAG